uniref:Expression site-associated gene 9 (ESAG9) protein n=1 Tax=Trypanosoma brucei brucei (strain 927/4 GUTat10.1) TaxID=185431 RepID=Q4FKJ7_TRYB2|nr:hypothetical protein Tb10.v4.0217 [Trypanosoma brucei brucei TREU927]
MLHVAVTLLLTISTSIPIATGASAAISVVTYQVDTCNHYGAYPAGTPGCPPRTAGDPVKRVKPPAKSSESSHRAMEGSNREDGASRGEQQPPTDADRRAAEEGTAPANDPLQDEKQGSGSPDRASAKAGDTVPSTDAPETVEKALAEVGYDRRAGKTLQGVASEGEKKAEDARKENSPEQVTYHKDRHVTEPQLWSRASEREHKTRGEKTVSERPADKVEVETSGWQVPGKGVGYVPSAVRDGVLEHEVSRPSEMVPSDGGEDSFSEQINPKRDNVDHKGQAMVLSAILIFMSC